MSSRFIVPNSDRGPYRRDGAQLSPADEAWLRKTQWRCGVWCLGALACTVIALIVDAVSSPNASGCLLIIAGALLVAGLRELVSFEDGAARSKP